MKFLIIIFSLLSFSDNSIEHIFQSEKRNIIPLSGNWSREETNGKKVQIELPFEETNNEVYVYTKKFKFKEGTLENGSWHIFFLGVESTIEVSVNGIFIGKYVGGNAPFYVSLPKKINREKELELRLQVNPPEKEIIFTKTKDQNIKRHGYGIFRDFYLINTSDIWLSNVRNRSIFQDNISAIKTDFKISTEQLPDSLLNQKFSVLASLSMNGEEVSSKQLEFDNKVQRKIDTMVVFQLYSPRYWQVSQPELYELKLIIYQDGQKIDDLNLKAGIAKKDIIDNKIYLNGVETKIKAVDYIDNNENDYEFYQKDIEAIKRLGANSIRFKYTSPHPYLTKLCDENGLMMFVDLPYYNLTKEISSRLVFTVNLSNRIKRFNNYYGRNVSLFSYGIDGQINFDLTKLSEVKGLIGKNYYKFYKSQPIEFGREKLSIISSYDKEFNDEYITGLPSDRAFIFEYGYACSITNNNGWSDKGSLQYQAHIIRNIFNQVQTKFSGSIIQSFNDYKLENPKLSTRNDDIYLASFGLMSGDRNTRVSYELVASLFKEEKQPLISAGSKPSSDSVVFLILGLFVIIMFFFLFNRLRRFREYFLRSILRPYNFYSDIRDQRIISTFQTVILGIFVSVTVGIFIANLLTNFKTSQQMEELLILLLPSKYSRESFINLVWEPELLMVITAVINFISFYLLAVILKIGSLLVKPRIYLHDTVSISIWSFLPLIILIIPSIFMNRLILVYPDLAIMFLGIFAFFLLWSLNRIIKSTSVVFDTRSWKIYTITISMIIFVLLIPLLFLELNHSVTDYVLNSSLF